ncbi:MAG: hypothetical protein AAF358_12575 [Pseudomonadota bacterium]
MRTVSSSISLIRTAGFALLLGLLAACSAARPPLNSEMIAERFGSYGLEIINQTADRRITNLFSGDPNQRVTRTLAVVRFRQPVAADLSASHRKILQGESLGATLKAAGWTVEKETLDVRTVTSGGSLAEMMRVEPGKPLAVHLYRLSAVSDYKRLPYAKIAEVHHPDHLTVLDLQRIYGGEVAASPLASGPLSGLWKTFQESLRLL